MKVMENKMESETAKKIEGALIEMNKIIQFSDKMLFDIMPLDKAAISFFSVLECKKRVDVNIIKSFYNLPIVLFLLDRSIFGNSMDNDYCNQYDYP